MAGELIVFDPVEVPTKYPRSLGRQPLNSVSDVRAEMARVYRHVAGGKISAKQGNAMIFMLNTLRQTIEVEKVEAQIGELRRRLE